METGEQIAVKIVPLVSTSEHQNVAERERTNYVKQIQTAREAAIASLVFHPYICGMRNVVRTQSHCYMLFEHINGGAMLDYIISHGRLKEKQARKFFRQITSAIDYCHRNSIIHRDINIENILLSKTGDVRIIDFGSGQLFAPASRLSGQEISHQQHKIYYMSPEVVSGRSYTGPEVDIWSVGIVLYILVCGKVPFDALTTSELLAKIKKGFIEYPPWLSAGKALTVMYTAQAYILQNAKT